MLELQILASGTLFVCLVLLKCYTIQLNKEKNKYRIFQEYKDSLDVV